MTPEQWRAARNVFEAVMEMSREQERLYLEEHCSTDEDLRSEVESLLRAYRGADDFMETPLDIQRDQLDVANLDSLLGAHVGPYQIVSEIGRGGMGDVYLAVRADDEYVKQVAIKIVPSGMNTRLWLSRFRYERQILASLEHPNIARMLDGGTIDGRPYFVMEYVDGKPIDDYAAEHQLSMEQRLRLFQDACKAVHFAHQNLIVHRDIKPANVLVTSQGIPKLLDFGIAKLMDPSDTGGQQTAVALMTPQYASPEQVRKGSVTTASDVYSLGVLLYQLLTTRMPYAVSDTDSYALASAICEQEPVKPRINADIDNIILKALQKEPSRRYSSALDLENDIDRYLRGLPVTARRDTFVYRTTKFVLRHKLATAGAWAAAFAILAAVAVTFIEYRTAERERQAAERRFDDVRHMADTFIFQIDDSLAALPGSTLVRQTLAKTALQYLDRLYQDSGRNRDLQRDLAAAYEKMAGILESPGWASMGGTSTALELWSKALKLRSERAAILPSDLSARKEWAESLGQFSTRVELTDTKKAKEVAEQAVALLESVIDKIPSLETTRSLAGRYYELGSATVSTGDMQKGLEAFEKSIQLLQEILRNDPSNDQVRRSVAVTNKRMGAMLGMNKQVDKALTKYHSALEIERALLAKNPTSVQPRRDLSVTYSDLGWLLYLRNDLKGALDSYAKALEIRQTLADADPANRDMHVMLASTHANMGGVLSEQKNWAGALDHQSKALSLRSAISAAEPANLPAQSDVAHSYEEIADVDVAAGNLRQALDNYEKASAIRRDLVKTDPASREYKVRLGLGDLKLGNAYHRLASGSALSTPQHCQMLEAANKALDESQEVLLALKEKGQIFEVESNEWTKSADEIRAVQAEWARCSAAPSSLRK